MTFENMTIKNNEFHTSTFGVRVTLNTDAAKPNHLTAQRFTVNDNLLYGNSTVVGYTGVRLQGQESNFMKDVTVNRNIINAIGPTLGSNINIRALNNTYIRTNEFHRAVYHISISTEMQGILRIEDNLNNAAATYRYTAIYTDSTTKKYINRNGLYTASGGFSATDFGTTANRPTVSVSDVYVGYQYFDTDTGNAIFWDGAAWV